MNLHNIKVIPHSGTRSVAGLKKDSAPQNLPAFSAFLGALPAAGKPGAIIGDLPAIAALGAPQSAPSASPVHKPERIFLPAIKTSDRKSQPHIIIQNREHSKPTVNPVAVESAPRSILKIPLRTTQSEFVNIAATEKQPLVATQGSDSQEHKKVRFPALATPQGLAAVATRAARQESGEALISAAQPYRTIRGGESQETAKEKITPEAASRSFPLAETKAASHQSGEARVLELSGASHFPDLSHAAPVGGQRQDSVATEADHLPQFSRPLPPESAKPAIAGLETNTTIPEYAPALYRDKAMIIEPMPENRPASGASDSYSRPTEADSAPAKPAFPSDSMPAEPAEIILAFASRAEESSCSQVVESHNSTSFDSLELEVINPLKASLPQTNEECSDPEAALGEPENVEFSAENETEFVLENAAGGSEVSSTLSLGDGAGAAGGRTGGHAARWDTSAGGATGTSSPAFFILRQTAAARPKQSDRAGQKSAAKQAATGTAPQHTTAHEAVPKHAPVAGSHEMTQGNQISKSSGTQAPRLPAAEIPLKLQHIQNLKELAEKIQARAQLANGLRDTLEVLLSPPKLGRLKVQVEMQGEDMHLVFTAEREEAAQALKGVRADLTHLVTEQGYTLTECEIESQTLPHRWPEAYAQPAPRNSREDRQNSPGEGQLSEQEPRDEQQRALNFGYNTMDLVA